MGSFQTMAETLTAPEAQPRATAPPRPTETHTRAPALERRITNRPALPPRPKLAAPKTPFNGRISAHRRFADIAAQHIGHRDFGQRLFEGARNRIFDQTLAQTDS